MLDVISNVLGIFWESIAITITKYSLVADLRLYVFPLPKLVSFLEKRQFSKCLFLDFLVDIQ
jgi:hypothetical protein